MHRDKIKELQSEMGNKNHANALMFIKGMFKSLNENGMQSQYQIFIYIFLFAIVILSMFGPIANLFLIEEPIIYIINAIGCFFYFCVICGLFGRCTCCCFYRPSNWIFIMLISDLATIIVNIIVIVMTQSLKEKMDNPYVIIIAAFNSAIDLFIIIPSHWKAYMAMQDIYRRSREYEINIIKKCVMKLVNEIKSNNI